MSKQHLGRLSLLEKVGAITRAGSGYATSPRLKYALDL